MQLVTSKKPSGPLFSFFTGLKFAKTPLEDYITKFPAFHALVNKNLHTLIFHFQAAVFFAGLFSNYTHEVDGKTCASSSF